MVFPVVPVVFRSFGQFSHLVSLGPLAVFIQYGCFYVFLKKSGLLTGEGGISLGISTSEVKLCLKNI